MQSRRHFLRFSCAALLASAGVTLARAVQPAPEQLPPHFVLKRSAGRATAQAGRHVWLPLVQVAPAARAGSLLGPPSGTASQATSWLAEHCNAAEYLRADVAAIGDAYKRYGEPAGLDWFLAIAQMAHETGSLTSWWSERPRRNPAGIGVTGRTQAGSADLPPGGAWAWDQTIQRWREGVSFPTWAGHSVPAHLGRLLAYALRDQDATASQRALIDYALLYRPLPDSYRGVAKLITDLNGRWAVPGSEYGQRIMDLARRMREAA